MTQKKKIKYDFNFILFIRFYHNHLRSILFSFSYFIFHISYFGYAQDMPMRVRDTSIFTSLIAASYSYQIPSGNLADRFGNNSNIGLQFLIKTKKNLLYGMDGSFLFGNKIKEKNLFKNIATKPNVDSSFIISQSGEPAEIRLFERGWMGSLKFGKLFPYFNPNDNSGFVIFASVGLLQHKIRIENPNNNTPQILKEYKKGYDRLTNGIGVSEFVGYVYLSNSRLINFFGGFEFTQAFTQSRRFDFDKMKKDDTKRKDYLSGIRIGWILPLYKKMPKEFYYN